MVQKAVRVKVTPGINYIGELATMYIHVVCHVLIFVTEAHCAKSKAMPNLIPAIQCNDLCTFKEPLPLYLYNGYDKMIKLNSSLRNMEKLSR